MEFTWYYVELKVWLVMVGRRGTGWLVMVEMRGKVWLVMVARGKESLVMVARGKDWSLVKENKKNLVLETRLWERKEERVQLRSCVFLRVVETFRHEKTAGIDLLTLVSILEVSPRGGEVKGQTRFRSGHWEEGIAFELREI